MRANPGSKLLSQCSQGSDQGRLKFEERRENDSRKDRGEGGVGRIVRMEQGEGFGVHNWKDILDDDHGGV